VKQEEVRLKAEPAETRVKTDVEQPRYMGGDPFEMQYDDDDESEEEESEQITPRDKMFAEWTKIRRQRDKFTCEFRNAIMHINGKDFVFKHMAADINY